MTKKQTPKENKGAFNGYIPTYQDASELLSVLNELKSDPVANNFYKLKLACIDAMVKLKPIVAQVEELSKPSDRYIDYIKDKNVLFDQYAEKEGGKEDGSPVMYKDMECTERVQPNDNIRVMFYNFKGKDDEVDEKHKVIKEKYKDAIATEGDREKTRGELLKSVLPEDFKLQHVGEDYPTNLPMRYLYSFLIFGIVSPKE